MTERKRGQAQQAADGRYEGKRAALPRFGGRCTDEEKQLLMRLAEENNISEKELVFMAVRFFEQYHK